MSACVEWPGPLTPAGYGSQRAHGEQGAHRVAWVEAHGPIPPGMHVLHRCDNRPCINTEHLFLGTNADNVADRQAKGRQACGLRHGMAKLSDEAVAEMRARFASGEQPIALARAFGVSKTLASLVLRGLRRNGPRSYTDEERARAAASMRRMRARRREELEVSP